MDGYYHRQYTGYIGLRSLPDTPELDFLGTLFHRTGIAASTVQPGEASKRRKDSRRNTLEWRKAGQHCLELAYDFADNE